MSCRYHLVKEYVSRRNVYYRRSTIATANEGGKWNEYCNPLHSPQVSHSNPFIHTWREVRMRHCCVKLCSFTQCKMTARLHFCFLHFGLLWVTAIGWDVQKADGRASLETDMCLKYIQAYFFSFQAGEKHFLHVERGRSFSCSQLKRRQNASLSQIHDS